MNRPRFAELFEIEGPVSFLASSAATTSTAAATFVDLSLWIVGSRFCSSSSSCPSSYSCSCLILSNCVFFVLSCAFHGFIRHTRAVLLPYFVMELSLVRILALFVVGSAFRRVFPFSFVKKIAYECIKKMFVVVVSIV
jgi:hypothetical protein